MLLCHWHCHLVELNGLSVTAVLASAFDPGMCSSYWLLKSLCYWYLSTKRQHPEYFEVVGEQKVFFHSVKCDQNSSWNKAQIIVMEGTWVIFPVWYFLKSQQFYLCPKLFLTTLLYGSLRGLVYT